MGSSKPITTNTRHSKNIIMKLLIPLFASTVLSKTIPVDPTNFELTDLEKAENEDVVETVQEIKPSPNQIKPVYNYGVNRFYGNYGIHGIHSNYMYPTWYSNRLQNVVQQPIVQQPIVQKPVVQKPVVQQVYHPKYQNFKNMDAATMMLLLDDDNKFSDSKYLPYLLWNKNQPVNSMNNYLMYKILDDEDTATATTTDDDNDKLLTLMALNGNLGYGQNNMNNNMNNALL